ncbi:MAG TPA: acetate uptake transporter [Streptosporangiaceae bacterium]|nr:acetate uptake transporter [Streptosporangiaceae bacterium]
MSVSEERDVRPVAAATTGIADPAPLGLAAFALTTFLFSAKNANWMSHAGGLTFIGYAFAYGGLVQLLAGMWEFRNRNVFGCTAFSSYGGFWIGAGLWIELHGVHDTPAAFNHDVAWINLAFLIFNTYMMIMSLQINMAVFGVFLTLGLTELFLAIGFFSAGAAATTGLIQVAGYLGLITAIVAWYTSMAGVANGMGGRIRLPVGKPLVA